jgi:hypothetical protein
MRRRQQLDLLPAGIVEDLAIGLLGVRDRSRRDETPARRMDAQHAHAVGARQEGGVDVILSASAASHHHRGDAQSREQGRPCHAAHERFLRDCAGP